MSESISALRASYDQVLARAQAAEARASRLEEALREIRDDVHSTHQHLRNLARSALAGEPG